MSKYTRTVQKLKEKLRADPEFSEKVKYPELLIEGLDDLDEMIGMNKVKETTIEQVVSIIENMNLGKEKVDMLNSLICGEPGSGKCLKKGTLVFTYSGELKKVEDVIVGDRLLGDDGGIRNVTGLGRGIDEMYTVTDEFGDEFGCNSEHILCLRNESGKEMNISLKGYINLPENRRREWKMFKAPLRANSKNIIENKNFNLLGGIYRNSPSIPEYVKNSNIESRKNFFRGTVLAKSKYNKISGNYILDSKYSRYLEDMKFIVQSLGLCAKLTKSSGSPGKLIVYPRSTFSFSIRSEGLGKYYGFELDGNHRFLLSNMTVSHNTQVAKILSKIYFSLGYLKGKKGERKSNEELIFMVSMFSYLILISYLFPTIFSGDYGKIFFWSLFILIPLGIFVSFSYLRKKDRMLMSVKGVYEESENFVKVTRKDLVSKYHGWTAGQTYDFLDKNRGKVLFFDEVYTLCHSSQLGNNDQYGEIALDQINEFISENPDSIAIIFAGYEDKIKDTIFRAQDGLARRFLFHYNVGKYTADELYQIFELKLKNESEEIFSGDKEKVKKLFNMNRSLFKNHGGDVMKLKNFILTKKTRASFMGEEVSDYITLKEVIGGFKTLADNDNSRKDRKVRIPIGWDETKEEESYNKKNQIIYD